MMLLEFERKTDTCFGLYRENFVSFQTNDETRSTAQRSTSTDLETFNLLGNFRNVMSNTEVRRSTDRSTFTDRHPSRDLAINTEPKITYSKDVGDFDVRYQFDRRPSREFGLQTDLVDTRRTLGYMDELHEENITKTTINTEKRSIFEENRRSRPIEDLVEESYEVVSTMKKPIESNKNSVRVSDLSISTSNLR